MIGNDSDKTTAAASATGSFFMASSSVGLHEAECKLVGEHASIPRRKVPRVGGVAQKLAFSLQHEARLLEFGQDDGFVDPMQRLADADARAGLRRVIDHDEMPAGL